MNNIVNHKALGLLKVASLVILASCTTVSGDRETKSFHITQIAIKSELEKGCLVNCDKLRSKNIPAAFEDKFSNALHHYAAAYNQLQSGAQTGYRLEVSVIQMGYPNCSTSGKVMEVLSMGQSAAGDSIIATESKLVDPGSGKVIREFSNNNGGLGTDSGRACDTAAMDSHRAKKMAEFILRRANLYKSTPSAAEKALSGVDILQPNSQPISPLS